MRDFVVMVNLEAGVCHALSRRLRSEGICCRILPATTSADEVLQSGARGVILAAGCSANAAVFPQMMDYLQSGLPMLCLGDAALTLCTALGGTVSAQQESGIVAVNFDQNDPLFAGIENDERYLPAMREMQFPEEQGTVCVMAAETAVGMRVRQRDVWGLNFPLDRNDPATPRLLLNFCQEQCGCTLWWTEPALIERAKNMIAEAAGEGEAVCALSGGVDSGVSAMLGHLALGQRLHCLFVDTGLLREGEAEEVMEACQQQVGLNVRRIDARAEFLLALKGVTDPGEKERIISMLLREILRREAEALPGVKVILKGTNFEDTPSTEEAAYIPAGMQVVEPVKDLFKDEIRHVGESMGLPASMINRQPFPGSGLACRIMAGVTAERLAMTRSADEIFRKEIEAAGLHRRLWQYYAALAVSPLPGGGLIVILRAVQAAEGGAGLPARLPGDLLERVTAQIMQDNAEVQRVFYDCTPSRSYARLAGK